jgi:ADP-ribosylglycohydrolase
MLISSDALHQALAELARHEHHGETTRALERAMTLAREQGAGYEVVESLGGGCIAEDALAMAAYTALYHPGPTQVREALTLAITHSGDSDSTGAICGNILRTLHGDTALPPELVFPVEGRGTIPQLADDLALEFTRHHSLHGSDGPRTGWERLYPGG